MAGKNGAAGRMYSRVPYRGCVMRLADDGRGPAELYATGFRSPDGIGFDAAGRLLYSSGDPDAMPLLRSLCDTLQHGSLCAMGGMTPYPVLSALNHYPADFGLSAPAASALES